MANWQRIEDRAPRVHMWKVDDKPCVPLEFQQHQKIIIEVRGNKSGKPVEIYGSLFGAPTVLLASTTLVNDILSIDPVRIMQPKAEAGTEIYVMGV